jgi:hypothetical protein
MPYHMAEYTSLEDIYRQAVIFPGPAIPLGAMRTALLAVERELAHARDQAAVQLRARHERDVKTLHPEDRDLDLYEHKVAVEQILPRVFRGGFVLILWSVFEVVSKRMAEYVCVQRGLPSSKSQWAPKGGESFLSVLERVYSQKLGILAFSDTIARGQLDQLREIRNALVHHNGSVAALPESIRVAGPEGFARLGLDHFNELHEEFVVPNADFLSRNFALVQTHLTSLYERAYAAAYPTALEDLDPKQTRRADSSP